MNIQKQITELTSQEMDRKKFLTYTGSVVLGVIGITGLLRILLGQKSEEVQTSNPTARTRNGYGDTPYGH